MKKKLSLFAILISLLFMIGVSSCTVIVKKDNGKHKGWYKQPIHSNEHNHSSSSHHDNRSGKMDEKSNGKSYEKSREKSKEKSKEKSDEKSKGKSK